MTFFVNEHEPKNENYCTTKISVTVAELHANFLSFASHEHVCQLALSTEQY